MAKETKERAELYDKQLDMPLTSREI